MQPSDNRPQDASAAQGVPPKDYAMLVLEDEDTEAYVADAQTVYVAETVLTKVYLVEGRFTDAEFRAWCLEMQTRHVIPFQNAHIMTAWVSGVTTSEVNHVDRMSPGLRLVRSFHG